MGYRKLSSDLSVGTDTHMYTCVHTKINIKCHEATETPVFLLVCTTAALVQSVCWDDFLNQQHMTGHVAVPESPRLPSSSVSTHQDEAVAFGRLRSLLCFSTGSWPRIPRVPPTSARHTPSAPVPVTIAPALPPQTALCSSAQQWL